MRTSLIKPKVKPEVKAEVPSNGSNGEILLLP